jgi:hypothetical protein
MIRIFRIFVEVYEKHKVKIQSFYMYENKPVDMRKNTVS